MLHFSTFSLGHHQEKSIKHKLSYLNLVDLLWIHIIQFFVFVILSEYTLRNLKNI
jgi:hypothetical protein